MKGVYSAGIDIFNLLWLDMNIKGGNLSQHPQLNEVVHVTISFKCDVQDPQLWQSEITKELEVVTTRSISDGETENLN